MIRLLILPFFILIFFFFTFEKVLLAGSDYAVDKGNEIEMPLAKPEIISGLAPVNFVVSGLNEESQKFFNQGISALHAFMIVEAERNFRYVSLLNPLHPFIPLMNAYAQTIFNSGNFVRGREYLELAKKLKSEQKVKLTEREEKWFLAVEVLYDANEKDINQRFKKHLNFLKEIANSFADDLETKAFLAYTLWGIEMESLAAGGKEESNEYVELSLTLDALVDAILAKNPHHPAHHYKIHINNNGRREIAARESAQLGGLSSPAAAHQWHMGAHIFKAIEEWTAGAFQTEMAHRVDNKYLQKWRLSPLEIHNYEHNFDWLTGLFLRPSGQVQKIIASSLNMIQVGRYNIDSSLNLRAALNLLGVIENFELWDIFLELSENGLFRGLKTNTPMGFKTSFELLRIEILSNLFTGKTKSAWSYFDKLKELNNEWLRYLNQDGSNVPTSNMRYIERLLLDVQYWRQVFELLNNDGQNLKINTLEKILELDFSNPVLISRLYLRTQNYYKAAAFLKGNLDDHSSFKTTLRAQYIYALAKLGEKDRVNEEVNKLKTEIIGDNYLWKKAPAFAAIHKLLTKEDLESMKTGKFLAYDYMKTDWREKNPDFIYKKPNYKNLAEQLRKDMKPGETILVAFVLGSSCLGCNRQLAQLAKYAKAFEGEQTKIFMITPDEPTEVNQDLWQDLKNELIEVVNDRDLKLFKAAGAFDEFDNKATHGLFLLDDKGQALWSTITLHAYENIEFLLQETKRQKWLEKQNLSKYFEKE